VRNLTPALDEKQELGHPWTTRSLLVQSGSEPRLMRAPAFRALRKRAACRYGRGVSVPGG
jgi:hypothetical protein